MGRRFQLASAGLVALAATMAAGCASNVVRIRNEDQFRQVVLENDQPVLVEFYKDGCAACWALDPGIEQLANDYKGRVTVGRFRMLNFVFWVQSWRIGLDYKLLAYPTVILFDRGQERKRWVGFYYLPSYRKAIDKVLEERAWAAAPPPRGVN